MKKALALILAVVMCLSLFAACGNSSSSQSSTTTTGGTTAAGETTTAAPAKPVELKVVTMFGGDDSHAPALKSLNKKFEEATGNTVKDNSAQADEVWKTKVVADFNGGNVPDVLYYFNGATGEPIVKSGKVVDLATMNAEFPEYGKNLNADIVNKGANVASDGKVYCMPTKGFVEPLYINKKAFEAAGATIPKSWDELMTAITKLNEAGITPFATTVGVEPNYFFEYLIVGAGGLDALKVSPKTMEEVPASWATGLAEIKTLYDAKAFPKNTATLKAGAEVMNLFLTSKAAMYLDGTWASGNIPTADKAVEGQITQDDVVMVPMPTKDAQYYGNTIAGYSSGWYVTTDAWNDPDRKAAAMAYVQFMTSDEAIGEYIVAAGGIPASAGVEAAMDPAAVTPLFKEAARFSAEDVKGGTYGPVQDTMTQAARTFMATKMIKVATGEMTAEDFVKGLVEQNNVADAPKE